MHEMKWPPTFSKEGRLNVVIEAPYKSRNKYSYDEDTGLFKLKKILPSGLSFPCDMGFIPGTIGEDKDPLDVLVLMDEITYPGCLVECRLLGAIKATQKEKNGKLIRNDRFICVPAEMKEYNHLKELKDMNKHKLKSITNFFIAYNAFYNISFGVIGNVNAEQAKKMIQKSII